MWRLWVKCVVEWKQISFKYSLWDIDPKIDRLRRLTFIFPVEAKLATFKGQLTVPSLLFSVLLTWISFLLNGLKAECSKKGLCVIFRLSLLEVDVDRSMAIFCRVKEVSGTSLKSKISPSKISEVLLLVKMEQSLSHNFVTGCIPQFKVICSLRGFGDSYMAPQRRQTYSFCPGINRIWSEKYFLSDYGNKIFILILVYSTLNH